MDLQGPSMTLRTACSSALTCLNEACMAISRGDCEAALVGGVNLILEPGMTIAMTEQGVLSKDGSCKTFSADANGYARGEAITAIYVKPLADAICDGNPVRAVIRGTSHNVDGRTPGMSQPSTDAQEKLIRRAYEVAGITDYNATAVVECHGTGTAVGDPIEAKAVARIFGEEGVHISSIKPNLGHAEGASGLVSVIKMVLALENRTIPPNIRFTSPNPSIPFESAKLTVPVEAMPWPTGKLQRVSVNSFGIGGANAHVILDSASRFQAQPVDSYSARGPQILLHSANTIASLDRLAKSHAQFAQENPVKVGDMAYTLAFRREALPHRSFTIVKDGGVTAASTPVKSDPSSTPDVVMIFTGQGAQWPLMGRELLRGNTVFRASIQALDGYLKAVQGEDAPDYSIEEELLKAGKKSRVGMATLSQPFVSPQGEKPSTLPVEPRIIETVHIPEEEYDRDTIVVAQPVRQRQEAITTPVLPLDYISKKEYNSDTIAVTPRGWNNYDDDAEIYIPDRHQNNAPQRRDPNLSQDNIITGRRRRQAHYIEAAPDLSKYFAFSATIAQANDAISATSQPTRSNPTRIYRDNLPPPPHHWKELKHHPHGKQFEAAAYTEFSNCWKKGTFAKLDITADKADAVPLMWVFTYKFDEDGYLLKYKARIVVRGDLQDQYGDTYAATLAAHLFRALMALACAFNLNAMQYDVPNAFLNATLNRPLHVRTPDRF
ncbi:Polyketide synthase [Pyrenophora tritici-repentis]|nr:Polyketide synthase [Pyrenophora tritici-repentis]